MADPISIAGTAVGLTSLGIQLCGILHQYFDAIKCREEDLASARRQTDSTRALLLVIQSTLPRIQQTHGATISINAAQACIRNCNVELERLTLLLAELQDAPLPITSLRQTMKHLGKKLSYAFRRDDLTRIEERLAALTSALGDTLTILGIDISQATFHSVAEGIQSLRIKADAARARDDVVMSSLSAVQRSVDDGNQAIEAVSLSTQLLRQPMGQILAEASAARTIGIDMSKNTSELTATTSHLTGAIKSLQTVISGSSHAQAEAFSTVISAFSHAQAEALAMQTGRMKEILEECKEQMLRRDVHLDDSTRTIQIASLPNLVI